MRNNRRHIFKITACMLLTLILAVGTASAASAATNKALKLINPKFYKSTDINALHGAEVTIGLPGKDKLKKSGMTISGVIFIPTKAFQAKGDQIHLYEGLHVLDSKGKDLGVIDMKYNIILELQSNNTVKALKYNWSTDKYSNAGKYAIVKKVGSYYKVSIRNAPLVSEMVNSYDVTVSIDTTTAADLKLTTTVFSKTKKAWKGSIYVDYLSVKTASKTQTVSFDSEDYKGIEASNWAHGALKYELVALSEVLK